MLSNCGAALAFQSLDYLRDGTLIFILETQNVQRGLIILADSQY